MKGLLKWKNSRRFYGLFWGAALLFAAIFGCIKTRNSYAFADAFVPVIDRNIDQITLQTILNNTTTNNVTWNATSRINFFKKAFGPASDFTSTANQQLNLRKIKLGNNVAWNLDVKYRWSALVRVKVIGVDSFASVNCPWDSTYTTRNIILDCKITALGVNQNVEDTYTDRLYDQSLGGLEGNYTGTQITFNSTKEYLYQMDIYGTYDLSGINSENLPLTSNELGFDGTFITWYGDGRINTAEVTIATTRFSTGYEYSEALEIAEQQRQQDQEDRNNVSSASDQAEGDGDSASSDASGKTTSLAGAAGTLISAVTSMHETNCKIPNFSIYGMQFNDMDFCQFPLPSGLSALASVGMVFLMVPFGIKVIKRMLNLYSEILGGK